MATATKHERHLYTHAVEQRVIMFRIVFCDRVRYSRPLPSPSARALFDTRHPTAQMRSAGYAATQLRMLWLADIPPDDRFAFLSTFNGLV
jgi:hypothetical protein